MKNIKPNTRFIDTANQSQAGQDVFNPLSEDGKHMRCCCGYELIKEDEKTWRCTGGSHRYIIDQGDVTLDKFGNILFRRPGSNT